MKSPEPLRPWRPWREALPCHVLYTFFWPLSCGGGEGLTQRSQRPPRGEGGRNSRPDSVFSALGSVSAVQKSGRGRTPQRRGRTQRKRRRYPALTSEPLSSALGCGSAALSSSCLCGSHPQRPGHRNQPFCPKVRTFRVLLRETRLQTGRPRAKRKFGSLEPRQD